MKLRSPINIHFKLIAMPFLFMSLCVLSNCIAIFGSSLPDLYSLVTSSATSKFY